VAFVSGFIGSFVVAVHSLVAFLPLKKEEHSVSTAVQKQFGP